MEGKTSRERANEFLRTAHLFRLGGLPTEQPHPETRNLAHWAKHDLPKAVSVLKGIDVSALETLDSSAPRIDDLARSVRATLDRERRVFLCGCGATGRLALSLEALWRSEGGNGDRVQSLMAGGDAALVHALEGFEDFPEFGARHLEQLGFADGDLLISCTEGGETPYVIGAPEKAAELSSNPPYFLYCNADSALIAQIARFRRVYRNPKIKKLCLEVGPMALAGSTRMQASTVLQLAAGLALLHTNESARERLSQFRDQVDDCEYSFLVPFIESESKIYSAGDHVTYRVRDYGITVFTDTTERAPTFSLVPFDQLEERRSRHSLCYVSLGDAESGADAWKQLLGRPPRPLNWPEVDPRTTSEYLEGFDFSARASERRRRRIPDKKHHEFAIERSGDGIAFRLRGLEHHSRLNGSAELFQHLLLKQLLNVHSTLVMGRLGRYEGNLMTWVSPTNGKLVDRAARYVQHLLSRAGRSDRSYADVVRQLFADLDRTRPGDSVVLNSYRSLLNGSR
jgi:N-acetylmuramic acid 6-phosphate etherase